MTTPETAAVRFLLGCALGCGIGAWHDSLKPLLRRHPVLGDLLLLCGIFWAWLVQSFDFCRGDLRLGYTAALGVGWLAWELTLGRFVTPVIFRFWAMIFALFGPVKKFIKFFGKMQKNYLHLRKNGLQ